MRDMTDNDIIKALECCTQQAGCSGCPFVISDEIKYRGGYSCSEALRKNALDLINRQQAEIERLEAQHREMSIGMKVLKKKAIEKFAEKLKNCFAISGDYLDIINIIDNLVKETTEQANFTKN